MNNEIIIQNDLLNYLEDLMQKSSNNRAHSIPHQWVPKRCTNLNKINKIKCAVCSNFIGFWSSYEKCEYCKLSVHGECKFRINHNCGLTPKHFKELFTQLVITARQDNWAPPNMGTSKSMNDMPAINGIELINQHVPDSSSSANSSTPTTPACFLSGRNIYLPNVSVIPPQNERSPLHTANICVARSTSEQFTFPEVLNNNIPHIILPPSSSDNEQPSVMGTHQGYENTLRPAIYEDDTKKESFNELKTDDNNWERNGYFTEKSHRRWVRRSWNMFTIRSHGSMSWSDETISSGAIRIISFIGCGRFGEVHGVDHFGTAAIKLLNMNHVDKDKRLEVFKQDTACFQVARHENLVFFQGYIIDQDRLGIVMELLTGQTVYQLLHDDDNDKRLDFNDVLDFAKQICQGMSFLHSKRILHKDLRSKNLFIKVSNSNSKERNNNKNSKKIVITDYGMFNVKRLAYPARSHSFLLPQHWLCYLAPECMRSLNKNLDALPFSERSDIYAFGTIWFEFLTKTFPFDCESPDSIVWQVGSGMKSVLVNVNTCREAKVLLMQCWSFVPSDRCSFAEAFRFLETMPKKPIRRNPSFPVCKSFESIF